MELGVGFAHSIPTNDGIHHMYGAGESTDLFTMSGDVRDLAGVSVESAFNLPARIGPLPGVSVEATVPLEEGGAYTSQVGASIVKNPALIGINTQPQGTRICTFSALSGFSCHD